jgi:uncharacterized protein (DUF697 family)
MKIFPLLERWLQNFETLRRLLLNPSVNDEELEASLAAARQRQPLPVIWLLGKTQAGKTSIIQGLTGSPLAEIGTGFRPCTRASRFYDYPAEAPVVRFLDTRGLGERAYDPDEDIHYCESQAHLVLVVMKALDLDQGAILTVLPTVRARHPTWPVIIAQSGLSEGYPPGQGHVLPYPYDQEGWPASVPTDLARALISQRETLGPLPGAGPLRWVPIDLTQPGDGLEPADYGLAALWTAIDAVTTSDLHTRLNADAEVRDVFARTAHPHIVGYALAAAGVGAWPTPAVGLVGVPAVQAKLLHSLSEIYQVPWDGRQVAEFLGFLGTGIGIGYLARLLGRELLKGVPVLGQTVGVAYGASVSGATTYALGKAACYYFHTVHRGERLDSATLRAIYGQAIKSGLALIQREQREAKAPKEVKGAPAHD